MTILIVALTVVLPGCQAQGTDAPVPKVAPAPDVKIEIIEPEPTKDKKWVVVAGAELGGDGPDR